MRTFESRIKRLEERRQRRSGFEQQSEQVQAATRDTWTWVRGYTETFNEHWVVEGRPTPYEKFPDWPYFPDLFAIVESSERILWFEKSRDMMLSWACMAFFTLKAMTMPECGVLVQTQKEKKAVRLIEYAKCLYRRQPQFLLHEFKLWKPVDQQPALALIFNHGGKIEGIPGRADQIRSYHPWGYLNDESSFQPDAGECYNEALSAVAGKIIFNSSAGPGWYADARRDIVRNVED